MFYNIFCNSFVPRGRGGMLYKVSYCTIVYDKVVVHMYNEMYRTPFVKTVAKTVVTD